MVVILGSPTDATKKDSTARARVLKLERWAGVGRTIRRTLGTLAAFRVLDREDVDGLRAVEFALVNCVPMFGADETSG